MIVPLLDGVLTGVFVLAAVLRGAPWPRDLVRWPAATLVALFLVLGLAAWGSTWFLLRIQDAPLFDLAVAGAFAIVLHFILAQVLAAGLLRLVVAEEAVTGAEEPE